MWIAAQFTDEDGNPVLGLSPVAEVIDFDTGAVILSGASMMEKSSGFYGYDYAAFDPNLDYLFVCDSVTLSGSNRYRYGTSGEYGEMLDHIYDTVDSIDVRTLLIKKIHTNKMILNDGDTGNWILYDDDNSTPLFTFNVTDKNGETIIQSAHVPSRRSKAT